MTASFLVSARMRVDHARGRLAELDQATDAWTNSKPYTMGHGRDRRTGDVVVFTRATRPDPSPPLNLGLMAGEVVHGLRAALGNAAWQLAGDSATSDTEFPIFESRMGYEQGAVRRLAGISEPRKALIDRWQPFHLRGRNHEDLGENDWPNVVLLIVRRLDNVDKHRILLPASAVAPFRTPEFENVTAATLGWPGPWTTVGDGRELLRVRSLTPTTADQPSKVVYTPVFTVLYGTGGPRPEISWEEPDRASATTEDLRHMIDTVGRMLDALEAA